LCDRYYHSTLAYQGFGRGLDLEWTRQITSFAVEKTRPDLTLLLVVPVVMGEARARRRNTGQASGPDRFERAGRDFFLRVEEGYRRLAAEDPGRVRTIDASGDLELVEAAVWGAVEPLLARL
jgi:dTMP kinase